MMLKISEIKVGERVRRDLGDLDELAASIAEHGQLQPIGVTKGRELIFGERRLRACRDVLGWEKIRAEVLDIEDIAFGERDENMVRKEFAPSERVRIANKVMEVWKKQGQRTDILQERHPEVKKGLQTRDLVAEKTGFGSSFLYEGAKHVEASGTQELIQMMDTGELSISAAGVLAKLPAEQQMEIVAKGAAEAAKAAASVRKSERDKRVNGKGKGKGKGKGRNKRLRVVADPDKTADGRPPRLNRFYLSLRSVFDTINEIGKEPAEFLEYAAQNRTVLDPRVTERVADFIGALAVLMQADRAA